MTYEESMKLLQTLWQVIFSTKLNDMDISLYKIKTNTGEWPGRWFKDSSTGQQTLRGFDFTCNMGDRIIEIRCIEQNPNKTDNFGNLKAMANRARRGEMIMWVIDRKQKGWDAFLGHLVGHYLGKAPKWVSSKDQATRPVSAEKEPYDYNSPEHEKSLDEAYAHIEKDINDPNFHGIPGTSGTMSQNLPIEMAMHHNLPGYQHPAAQAAPVQVEELPEVPDDITVPEYLLEAIADDDDPPDFEKY